jgi:hypothetical protein
LFGVQPSQISSLTEDGQEAPVECESSEELLPSSPNGDERDEADTPVAESGSDSAVEAAGERSPPETAPGDTVIPIMTTPEPGEQAEEQADEDLKEHADEMESVVKVV